MHLNDLFFSWYLSSISAIALGKLILSFRNNDNDSLRKELLDLCEKNLAKYSIPKEWKFRKSLPKTIVGKVDFRKLQEENMRVRRDEK